MSNEVDIIEDDLLALDKDIFIFLLKDHSRSHYFAKHNNGNPEDESKQENIHWMTHDYEERGKGYQYNDAIKSENISGTYEKSRILMPRVLKDKHAQTKRTRDMAEVFTPSWICNKQNNLIDEAWFGRKDVFNHENEDNTWTPTEGKIVFPDIEGKTWRDYVAEHVLEITCGEAPYLVSRYDTTTGEKLPLEMRIGLLDRKLRVVDENAKDDGEWWLFTQVAFGATYGYEWQGDSLLLAREALLYTFVEHYRQRYNSENPEPRMLQMIAYIVSWNVFQMDGLKGVVPETCANLHVRQVDLFGETEQVVVCQGCKEGTLTHHNGIYCEIVEWSTIQTGLAYQNGKFAGDIRKKKTQRFIDLFPKKTK